LGAIEGPGGRTPTDAVDASFRSLQLALSTVTVGVLRGRAGGPPTGLRTAAFPNAQPAGIGRRTSFLLDVVLGYEPITDPEDPGRWRVRTASYLYEVRDRQSRKILSYHWHPRGRSAVVRPHLHIEQQTSPTDLSKAHLPTGNISLVDVVRMAITELGAEPLRPDWLAALDRAERELAD
jgi:hypothetical protein